MTDAEGFRRTRFLICVLGIFALFSLQRSMQKSRANMSSLPGSNVRYGSQGGLSGGDPMGPSARTGFRGGADNVQELPRTGVKPPSVSVVSNDHIGVNGSAVMEEVAKMKQQLAEISKREEERGVTTQETLSSLADMMATLTQKIDDLAPANQASKHEKGTMTGPSKTTSANTDTTATPTTSATLAATTSTSAATTNTQSSGSDISTSKDSDHFVPTIPKTSVDPTSPADIPKTSVDPTSPADIPNTTPQPEVTTQGDDDEGTIGSTVESAGITVATLPEIDVKP